MAYILKRNDGKRFSSNSYYEFVKEKEALRAKGISFEVNLTGEEKKGEESRQAQKSWERLRRKNLPSKNKIAIRNFLQRCDIVEQRYKKFNRREDGRVGAKS